MHSGIVNIYKERGFTSNDVVQIVKRLTKSKAGHTGTLDPQATGVLPICLGKATKIADYIMAGEKQYIARVVLGSATDTQDAHGQRVAESNMLTTQEEVLTALSHFLGEIAQVPPMFSAVKIGGKRLYQQARAGIDVERPPRQVAIHNLEVLRWDLGETPQSFVLRVDCGKGTYIRTLCHDLGERLGTYAHMGALLRTKSGAFGLQTAITLRTLERVLAENRFDDHLVKIEDALMELPKITMPVVAQKSLVHGNKVALGDCLVYDHNGELVGIHHIDGGHLRPKTMLRN